MLPVGCDAMDMIGGGPRGIFTDAVIEAEGSKIQLSIEDDPINGITSINREQINRRQLVLIN